MKLLIVDTVSNDRAPYLKYYEKACKDNYIDHDFFLWDRYNDGGLEKNGNCFLYHKICPYGEGKIRKLFPVNWILGPASIILRQVLICILTRDARLVYNIVVQQY